PRIVRALRPVAAEIVEPMMQIDIIASEASFRDDRCNAGSHLRGTFSRSINNHARKPRRQRKRAQLAAFFRNAAVAIDSPQLGKQGLCLRKRGPRGRIEKRKLSWIARAPLRK